MKAILLAAGFGTRLRPLTESVPKCLVPVGGRPLLAIWLEQLTRADIGPFLVNTHYLAEQVHQFLSESEFLSQVKCVHETELLGTAGTLLANLDFFDGEDGMLIHADNYCSADFGAFVRAHQSRPSGCELTMLTFRTNTPRSCGIVELDDNNVVKGFHEKVANPPGNLANGAIYILSTALLGRLHRDYPNATDFSTQVLPSLVGKIYSHETTEYFIDIGTPESYEQANIAASRAPGSRH